MSQNVQFGISKFPGIWTLALSDIVPLKDVWAYKISAQNLLYFRSYKIFSGGKSEAKIGLELRELKFITKY